MILITSIFALVWTADQLVQGASAFANNVGVRPLIIGLTIVAFGTSSPEIMVSITSAIQGKGSLAIGNAIGSNIANIGLVIGLTGLLRPLKLDSTVLKREYPILFLIMLFLWVLILDGDLNVLDGSLLLLGCIALIVFFILISQKANKVDPIIVEYSDAIKTGLSMPLAIIKMLIGFVLLPVSSYVLVNSAVDIAQYLGISEFVIGMTIIAIGTSLPELATSVVAVLKDEDDIAIGNILGSNMFNILAVMSFPGMIDPGKLTKTVLWRDFPVMVIFVVLLLIFNYKSSKTLTRANSLVLLSLYVIYMFYLVYTAVYN